MEYLTKEAREYCTAALLTREREDVVQELESICVACYDDETMEDDLVPSMVDSVEAKDIDFDWSFAASKQYPHSVQMLWLDVDEVWTKEKPR